MPPNGTFTSSAAAGSRDRQGQPSEHIRSVREGPSATLLGTGGSGSESGIGGANTTAGTANTLEGLAHDIHAAIDQAETRLLSIERRLRTGALLTSGQQRYEHMSSGSYETITQPLSSIQRRRNQKPHRRKKLHNPNIDSLDPARWFVDIAFAGTGKRTTTASQRAPLFGIRVTDLKTMKCCGISRQKKAELESEFPVSLQVFLCPGGNPRTCDIWKQRIVKLLLRDDEGELIYTVVSNYSSCLSSWADYRRRQSRNLIKDP